MILGRPTNLWLGFVTAVVGFASVTAVAVFKADPTVVATVAGSATGLTGALVVLVAGQPPTLNPGDAYKVVTPGDAPNAEKIANTNMTPQPPVPAKP
jgi:hypothetical protein